MQPKQLQTSWAPDVVWKPRAILTMNMAAWCLQFTVTCTLLMSELEMSFEAMHSYIPDCSLVMEISSKCSPSVTNLWPPAQSRENGRHGHFVFWQHSLAPMENALPSYFIFLQTWWILNKMLHIIYICNVWYYMYILIHISILHSNVQITIHIHTLHVVVKKSNVSQKNCLLYLRRIEQ